MVEPASPTKPSAAASEVDGKLQLSWQKKLLFSLVIAALATVAVEATARVYHFAKDGGNPYFLTFGFVNNTDAGAHSYKLDGYTKFEPGTTLHQKSGDKTIDIAVNSGGFRAIRDFEMPKPTGRIRIVTMGASAVFGYYSADDETFPAQLEAIPRKRHPGKDVEVCNLGIPHATTRNIHAMAKAEFKNLQPDLLIIYAGANDAGHPAEVEDESLAYRIKDWLFFHSMAWRTVHWSVKNVYYAMVRATNINPIQVAHLGVPVQLTNAQLETMGEAVEKRFTGNLTKTIEVAKAVGAQVMFVSQPTTARFGTNKLLAGKILKYSDEGAILDATANADGGLPGPYAALHNHRRLMKSIRKMAADHGALFVDGIAAVDVDRTTLVSYVHLSPEGNRLVAEAIASGIDAAAFIR